MTAVLLVDTTMGNLRSVERALARAGGAVEVSSDPDRVRAADRVVVPGQGHFGAFRRALDGGLGDALVDHVKSGRPYLGICLGMQILFERSEEDAGAEGLGLFPGRVRRFAHDVPDPEAEGRRLKVPHMGWNQVEGFHPMLPSKEWFYFVHSYYCEPTDEGLVAGWCDYGVRFAAAVASDHVFACQFHPEKSQHAGARLLTKFLEGRWT